MDYKDYLSGSSDENFWFKSKNNLLNVLLSKIKTQNTKILSIGTGTGGELKTLNKFGEVYVLDINKKALALISKELYNKKILGDVQALPFGDEFFDIVVASDVLEHVKNDKKALKEIRRVLKRGGSFVFTVPAHQFLFSAHDRALGHKRRYSHKSICNLLKDFTSIRTGYWNFSLSPLVIIKRLSDKNADAQVDQAKFPSIIDIFLFAIMEFENFFIKINIPLPYGITIFGICKK